MLFEEYRSIHKMLQTKSLAVHTCLIPNAFERLGLKVHSKLRDVSIHAFVAGAVKHQSFERISLDLGDRR